MLATRVSGASVPQTRHQHARVDVQRFGDLEDVVEREIALASLDLADEGPVHVAAVGQGFLAEAERLAMLAHTRTELTRGGRDWWLGSGAWHETNPIRPKTCNPETMYLMTMYPVGQERFEEEIMSGGGDFPFVLQRPSIIQRVQAWLRRQRALRS